MSSIATARLDDGSIHTFVLRQLDTPIPGVPDQGALLSWSSTTGGAGGEEASGHQAVNVPFTPLDPREVTVNVDRGPGSSGSGTVQRLIVYVVDGQGVIHRCVLDPHTHEFGEAWRTPEVFAPMRCRVAELQS